TLQFTLNDNSLPQPPPTQPPTFTQNLAMLASDIKGQVGGVIVTNVLQPHFTGATNPGTRVTVYEFRQQANGNFVPYGSPRDLPSTELNANGLFPFLFANPNNVGLGPFQIYVVASWINTPNGAPAQQSNTVPSEINNQVPPAVTNFRLKPADDTGIVG